MIRATARKSVQAKRLRRIAPVGVVLALVVPLLSVSNASAVATVSKTFAAADDTYGTQSDVGGTRGPLPYFLVTNTAKQRIAYLKFNVSGVPFTATGVKSTLKVHSQSTINTEIQAHAVSTNEWGQDALTWNNKPAFDPAVLSEVKTFENGTDAVFDVSSLVTGNGTYSIALAMEEQDGSVRFEAAEAPTVAGPRLNVQFLDTPPTTGTINPPTTPSTGTRPPTTLPPTTLPPTTVKPTTTVPPTTVVVPPPSGKYTHVVNIWMENKAYNSIIGAFQNAPYENQLATTYGLATNFQNLTHPSEPNYVAANSGSTQGITDNNPPSTNAKNVQSVFGELDASGKTWKAYQEDMPSNCALTNSGAYAVKHNPAPFFTPLRSSCQQNDVPMGTINSGNFINDLASGLPNYSFITPNMNNDTHDASVATGDNWLKMWVPKIMAGKDYQAGNTVIIISWDETAGGAATQAEIVVSPTTHAVSSNVAFNHYSRLAYIEDLFGVARLGSSAGANGAAYKSAFGL